ncbi:MAG TPA: type II toxin-antitoxin system VapC family toxin [Polyangia bacterium]|nr:type II toxin-antitoxin system VapC family toxin [Polyangia bacterium]
MTVYLDSSAILRRLLGQPGALREWRLVRTGVSSRLTEVECLRTLDRLRLEADLDGAKLAALREALYAILATLEIIELTRTVMIRAAQPSATPLGTLDAIHLASALIWRERTKRSLTMATHDQALALGARAYGMAAIGISARA